MMSRFKVGQKTRWVRITVSGHGWESHEHRLRQVVTWVNKPTVWLGHGAHPDQLLGTVRFEDGRELGMFESMCEPLADKPTGPASFACYGPTGHREDFQLDPVQGSVKMLEQVINYWYGKPYEQAILGESASCIKFIVIRGHHLDDFLLINRSEVPND